MSFIPTPEQDRILRHEPDRHAHLLAGPGTGKSTTMVLLLDQLLDRSPGLRVRLLTFTRAATAELAEKVGDLAGSVKQPSTIHSFALSVLMQNPGVGGLPEPLRIADDWEKRNIVWPTLASRLGLRVKEVRDLERAMAANWESLSDDPEPGITVEERTRFLGAWGEHRRVFGYSLLSEIPYALRRALQDHEELSGLEADLLLVDEYQDLNACDLAVIKLVSERTGCSIVATGDDDQSIYSFRKAAPEGIRRFPVEFAPVDQYSLSTTQRCGKQIIEWANHVIQGDPDRPSDRGVLTARDDAPDGSVALLRFPSGQSEARGIARLTESLLTDRGQHAVGHGSLVPSDVLILLKSDHNRMFSKPIREELERRGIPHSDPSEVTELLGERDHRMLLEAFRLLVNPRDSIAWHALLQLHPRVGSSFLDYAYARAKAGGASFANALLAAHGDGFPDGPRSCRAAAQAIQQIETWLGNTELPETPPEDGWGDWLVDQASASNFLERPRIRFKDLLKSVDEMSEEVADLGRYLGRLEPLAKDIALAQGGGVRIMTMLGSKGLTVRAAILGGVEEGLIPRPGSDTSEERRLLYVAMTRAKEHLYCTWAQRRQGPTARAGYATEAARRPSHFLDEGPVMSIDGDRFLS